MDTIRNLDPDYKKKKKRSGLFLFYIITILTTFSLIINFFVFQDILLNNDSIQDFVSEGNYFNQFPGEKMDDVISKIDGRIPILEYHIIDTPTVDSNVIAKGKIKKNKKIERFFVTSEEFRNQLENLYDNQFRNISLDEYLSLMNGQKKDLNRLPPDSKLYVLTFDDSTYGQFDFTGLDDNGEPIIDKDCAVGIMVDFAKKHPDFKLNAAFSVVFDKTPFMQSKYVGKKLNMLLDYGFEIVNHTKNHRRLSKYIQSNPDIASFEIGRAMELFESYLGYRAATINKIAYPFGETNPNVWDFVKKVTYNGKEYRFIAALNAAGLQAKNPNEENFNFYNISRIETSRSTFKTYVLNAKGLFKTPSQEDKIKSQNYAFSPNLNSVSNTLDLIKLR